MKIIYILSFYLAFLTGGTATHAMDCSKSNLPVGVKTTEGFINVIGGKIWYRIVGGGPGTPVLLVHAGPGAESGYLKPLAALANERPVIFYDQLGSGRSDRPHDTSLWDVSRFADEIAKIREALGLKEIHLYGHSFGTMVVAQYMLNSAKTPSGVKSVIFGSPALSIPLWTRDTQNLIGTLPQFLKNAVTEAERTGNYNSFGYKMASAAYYKKYIMRKMPRTKYWGDYMCMAKNFNEEIYKYMQGPSEFTITGTVKDFDVISQLPFLNVPTLFMAGEYDEAVPSTVRYYQSLVPGAEMIVIPGSGHFTINDNPAANIQGIRKFLKKWDD